MNEIVRQNVLEYIQDIIRIHNIRLSDQQIQKANSYILSFFDGTSVIEKKHYRTRFIDDKSLSLADKKDFFLKVVRYYAYTQDNISLFEKLCQKNFFFGVNEFHLRLYIFDSLLSSAFEEEEYIFLFSHYNDVFYQFYRSLLFVPEELKKKVIQDFAEIIHKDPSTLDVGSSERENSLQYNYLNYRNISLFGKEFLLSANENQRNVINSLYCCVDEEGANKIKSLLIKYPSFSTNMSFVLSQDMLPFFSVDELGNMTYRAGELFRISKKRGLFFRMKELLERNPSFDCPDGFIREELFRELDNNTILNLSDEAKEKLAGLKIPKLNNVLIFPIKQINIIVAQDYLKQKKERLKNKIHR